MTLLMIGAVCAVVLRVVIGIAVCAVTTPLSMCGCLIIPECAGAMLRLMTAKLCGGVGV